MVNYNQLSQTDKAFVTNLDIIQIPRHIQEAIEHLEWRKTVEEVLRALQKNQTWTIVQLSQEKRLVRCKWIFTVKYKANATLRDTRLY